MVLWKDAVHTSSIARVFFDSLVAGRLVQVVS